MKLVSDAVFYWFLVAMLLAISFGWTATVIVRLRRELRLPKEERSHDRMFSYFVGFVLTFFGAAGVIKNFAGW